MITDLERFRYYFDRARKVTERRALGEFTRPECVTEASLTALSCIRLESWSSKLPKSTQEAISAEVDRRAALIYSSRAYEKAGRKISAQLKASKLNSNVR